MKFQGLLFVFAIIASLLQVIKSEIYSVIVAGSNKWTNYRHQADVCHAYQILIQNGVKAENIIMLAYNDIAYDKQNPFPGAMYNSPSPNGEGNNIYEGCVIDYEGKDVTKENYFAILRGEKDKVVGGNGRVLESTEDDEVFLFYSDHGNVGFVSFPEPYGEEAQNQPKKSSNEYKMFADEINTVLKDMHQSKMYNELTYYMNACHSGSMFMDGELADNINIYTMTAANYTQSGWGCFCPPNDIVDGVSIDNCLSSQFPASWMQNTDYVNTNAENLQQQYLFTRTTTTLSQVQQWGDLSMTSSKIAKFLGGKNQDGKPISSIPVTQEGFLGKVKTALDLYKQNRIIKAGIEEHVEEQRQIEMNYLLRQHSKNPSEENFQKLQDYLNENRKFQAVFTKFLNKYQLNGEYIKNVDYKCYREILEDLDQQCGSFNDYTAIYAKYLHQYCAINRVYESIDFGCQKQEDLILQ